jgi:vacuolar-type H+-ATPase subunit D/Vma8
MRPFKIAVDRNMINGVTEVRFSFTGDPAESEVPLLLQLQYGSDATAQLRALTRLCVSLIEAAEKEGKIARELQEANRLMNMQDQKNWGAPVTLLKYKPGKNNGP